MATRAGRVLIDPHQDEVTPGVSAVTKKFCATRVREPASAMSECARHRRVFVLQRTQNKVLDKQNASYELVLQVPAATRHTSLRIGCKP
jgi:hypothetical protein